MTKSAPRNELKARCQALIASYAGLQKQVEDLSAAAIASRKEALEEAAKLCDDWDFPSSVARMLAKRIRALAEEATAEVAHCPDCKLPLDRVGPRDCDTCRNLVVRRT